MRGFDAARARSVLRIPDEFAIDAMAAVGRPGRKEDLPETFHPQESPNSRRPLSETVFEGAFPGQ
jgi:hypothetical protein